MTDRLPFDIEAEIDGRYVRVTACVGGDEVTTERYILGNGTARRKVARQWATDARLLNGRLLATEQIVQVLDQAELDVRALIDGSQQDDDEREEATEATSYVDDDIIVELAWNCETHQVGFICFDRHTHKVRRSQRVQTAVGPLCPPTAWRGICTPGYGVPGCVLLPTDFDESGLDEDRLRHDLSSFISRYVELPGMATALAVVYVLLTWVFDAFAELPYLALRTVDIGRGKSRALLTIASVCYRAMIAGGGSSAAALRRIVDIYRGTLACDEFDVGRDSELTSTVTKILNQGFEVGRPLLLCVGDDNAPRPFHVFGPKLFCLRKKLGDDASESRTISVWMKQRTRDDIPINLPYAQFSREALAIRNRLLAWRCTNLERIAVDPTLADRRLEDRLNQIGAALFAIAGDGDRDIIVRALLEQQQSIAADRGDSLAGEVFDAAFAIYGAGDIVRPADVKKELERRRADVRGTTVDDLFKTDRVSVEKVAWVVRAVLELPRGEPRRDRDGARYVFDPKRVSELCQRFGVDFPQPSQPSHRHTDPDRHTKTSLLEYENGDCDGRDSRDGLIEPVRTSTTTVTPTVIDDVEVDDSDRLEREARMEVEAEAEAVAGVNP